MDNSHLQKVLQSRIDINILAMIDFTQELKDIDFLDIDNIARLSMLSNVLAQDLANQGYALAIYADVLKNSESEQDNQADLNTDDVMSGVQDILQQKNNTDL